MPGVSCPMLHNMSVAPRTVLAHAASHKVDPGGFTVFELPEGITDVTAPALLSAIGGGSFRGATSRADARLRKRVDERARELAWPAAVLAVDQADDQFSRCSDLLTIITALSKTGARAYLRDKEPNLAGLAARRRVVLKIDSRSEHAL